MRNVHEFDGKTPIKLPKQWSEDQIIKIKNDALFLSSMNPKAFCMATKLLEENQQNIDPINHVDARQLFASLLEKLFDKENKEMIGVLEEQLTDMLSLGQCPQGRSIRLWQLYQCLV